MSWLEDIDMIEISSNNLSKDFIKKSLEGMVEDCVSKKRFDWRKYSMLVKFVPYIDLLTPKKREILMKTLSGQVLDRLEGYEEMAYALYTVEEEDIPSLFELKNVIVSIWNEGYEPKYMIKSIDKIIKKLITLYDKSKYEYVDMFFSQLEYPYTKESLKKCKVKIIKENHPDNGGDGEYIQIVQSIYKIFLDYIS